MPDEEPWAWVSVLRARFLAWEHGALKSCSGSVRAAEAKEHRMF